ncbi:hypothetical protein KPA96_13900 [Burkholderia cenocepacia]|uniref:hypothetical protein n=1 Tax=Burkholderia cenocepacia TaxID=95486 RepID=UPI0028672F4E|nr:hypothetical protein [Burkholderia cenocepacia]MCB4346854.1 hypothetical protein [Burkholderia vietnamiensis]MDR8076751.1 hypothetical protein [Burkholderia cenocepacia]
MKAPLSEQDALKIAQRIKADQIHDKQFMNHLDNQLSELNFEALNENVERLVWPPIAQPSMIERIFNPFKKLFVA